MTRRSARPARVTGARRLLALSGSLLVGAAALAVPAGPAAASPAPDQLYVAPWGKDSWPGTVERPFATLERARQSVRERTPGMRSDVVVNLHGGTYTLTAPFRLSAAAGDSGGNGHQVIYQAYGYGTPEQEDVVISGGRELSGWRPAGDGTGVWQADVGDLDTRQLYVDGRRARRAALGRGLPGNLTRTGTGYVTDSTEPQSWGNPEDIELVYQGAFTWAEARCGVASITGDATSTTITMDQPCFDWANRIYYLPAEDGSGELVDTLIEPTGVENSPSFLREPGSWYLDRSKPGTHVLHYLPRPGEDPRHTEVVAPVLETLVSGEGEPGAPLHDVALKGLTFAYATWLAPSEPTGFVNVYGSEYYNGGPFTGRDPGNEDSLSIPGNVAFRTAERITVEGNRFIHLGGQGLELSRNSSENLVRGNVFDDISGGGLQIGVMAPEVTGTNRGNAVDNNWVHDIGVDYRGSIGINLEQTQDSTIAHNQVNNVPYTGIAFNNDPMTTDPGRSVNRNMRILNNLVVNAASVIPDGAGIYSFGPQGTSFADGAVVRGNVVRGTTHELVTDPVVPFPNGIYTDFGNWVTVQGNVLYGNHHAYGLGFLDPGNIRYRGNVWDDAEPGWWPPGTTPPDVVEVGPNTLLPRDGFEQACAADPTCAGILEAAGLEPAYRGLLGTG